MCLCSTNTNTNTNITPTHTQKEITTFKSSQRDVYAAINAEEAKLTRDLQQVMARVEAIGRDQHSGATPGRRHRPKRVSAVG